MTGRINDETIAAIEAAQDSPGTTKDGHVSVAKGYTYGSAYFTIVNLNFSVRVRFASKWPNVDELPGCPGLLNLACRRALIGSD